MTTQQLTEEQQNVHNYLRGQGEKYSWLDLWPRVLRPRLDLLAQLDGITAVQRQR